MAGSSKVRSVMYIMVLLSSPAVVDVQAMPAKAPMLVITSSVPLGRPIFDENIGPIRAHQNLTLTCTLEAAHEHSLSWWEKGTQLDTIPHKVDNSNGSSLTLLDLKVTDSGRRFTCKDKDSGNTQDAVIKIIDPSLVITSSVNLGKPIFDENIGPISAHQDLTLTCTIKAPQEVSLSWWEEGIELDSVLERVDDISGSSLTLQDLKETDSGRRFTCRDKDTGLMKDAVIEIVGGTLEITSSVLLDKPIFDEKIGPIRTHQDLTLTCTVEAPHDVPLSWWEEGIELESVLERVDDISGSSLTLQDLKLTDSGRRFTCRDKDTGLTKDAVIEIVDAALVITSSIPLGKPIFDEKIGPILANQDLTLICTIEIPQHVSLSWWEDGIELESVLERVDDISGSSLTLQDLKVTDSGRRFTCTDKETGITKDAVIEIVEVTSASQLPVLLLYAFIALIFFAIISLFVMVVVLCHYHQIKMTAVNVHTSDKRTSNVPLMDEA